LPRYRSRVRTSFPAPNKKESIRAFLFSFPKLKNQVQNKWLVVSLVATVIFKIGGATGS
jgi:hypothetical protein